MKIMDNHLVKNKQNAIEFYKMSFLDTAENAVKLYVGDGYIQHNPLEGNGKQPVINYSNKMQEEFPEKPIELVRAIYEDNAVACHTHQTWPGREKDGTMDFFRFDSLGKILEYGDSMQLITEHSKSGNAMH